MPKKNGMKNTVFVSFCTAIVAGVVSVHALNRDSFSPSEKLKEQLQLETKTRQDAELRAQLLHDELNDYQQHIATLLPKAIHAADGSADSKTAYSLRQLASVAERGEGDGLAIERGSGLFESAKGSFRDEDFEESNRRLEKLITRFPASAHVAEAHFLLAEGQFRLRAYDASVKTIEKMIDLYPENDLTGFALLRLGDIFQRQDRLDDAGDIYRAVLANFRQPELVRQANENLKAVAL